jgi:hypothetical protein
MSHCNETIAGLEAAIAAEKAKLAATPKAPLEIIIGQRGWVWIGRVTVEGDQLTIHGACCIRQWGTTKGLAELCAGPTSKTVLDIPCSLKVGTVNVLGRLSASESGWSKLFS